MLDRPKGVGEVQKRSKFSFSCSFDVLSIKSTGTPFEGDFQTDFGLPRVEFFDFCCENRYGIDLGMPWA